MPNMLFVSLRSDIDDVARALQEIAGFLESRSLPDRTAYVVTMAAEEILTNVIKYAFEAGDSHEITVEVSETDGSVRFTCTDHGREFNPLDAGPPPSPESLEDSQIGGLGIHLIRSMVDDLWYSRDADRNVFTVVVGARRS